MDPGLKALLKSMLHVNPQKRVSWGVLVKKTFLAQILNIPECESVEQNEIVCAVPDPLATQMIDLTSIIQGMNTGGKSADSLSSQQGILSTALSHEM